MLPQPSSEADRDLLRPRLQVVRAVYGFASVTESILDSNGLEKNGAALPLHNVAVLCTSALVVLLLMG